MLKGEFRLETKFT